MKPQFDLSHKKVLVTGGASGIGLATVRAFASNGATVAINDLPGEKLDTVVSECTDSGYKVVSAAGNVGEAGKAGAMIDAAINAMGGLDYLVNNAGTPAATSPIAPSDFDRQDEDFWNRLLNVNLLGPYRCTKASADALRQSSGGAIVNTAVSDTAITLLAKSVSAYQSKKLISEYWRGTTLQRALSNALGRR